ncbi:MAG: DUF4856 domain-containing protein [Chitinophagaceae bacterium]|nr:DUF4856 domain-containing protein [Chitinophagaceae bacterium]
MKSYLSAVIAAGALLTLSSCEKDQDPVRPPYTVPDTYTFDNVDYKESNARVIMSLGIGSYLSKANSRELSQDTINYLWNNTNNAFTSEIVVNQAYTFSELNGFTYNVAEKTADAAIFKAFADSMVVISQARGTTGSQGVPGKVGNRVVNYRGLEFNQLVAKGFFGALSLNNIVALLNKVPSDNNTTIVPGTGTAMQHDWDLAFGYVGLPKNYDSSINYTQAPNNTNPERPIGIGGYFWERARPIQAGGIVFEAFRKGRAAIGAKDYATRNAAAETIKEYLEKTLAAAAYAYLSLSKTRTTDEARFHDFSEGTGFMLALKYRPTTKLTEQAYQEILGLLNVDFWTLSDAGVLATKVDAIQAKLVAAYGKLD